MQPLLLTLNKGYFLTATPPDSEHGVAPFGHPVPAQPPLFGLGVAPGCSLEGLMLRLKLQYFGHLMQRFDSLEKTLVLGTLMAGREGDGRGLDGWMASAS